MLGSGSNDGYNHDQGRGYIYLLCSSRKQTIIYPLSRHISVFLNTPAFKLLRAVPPEKQIAVLLKIKGRRPQKEATISGHGWLFHTILGMNSENGVMY